MLIFFRKAGYETGQILGDKLRLLETNGLSNVRVSSDPERIRDLVIRSKYPRNITLMRWGVTAAPEIDDIVERNGGQVVNYGHALENSVNKLKALGILANYEVSVPRTWTDKFRIDKFPVLGRDRYHHGGLDVVKIDGCNILKYNDFTKIPKKDFYVEFINAKDEYRVHVFDGEIIRVTKKVFRGTNRDGGEILEAGNIRNDIYGWGHHNVEREDWDGDVCNEANKAIGALNLDFGAVDVIVETASQKPYVLEINSAPRLNTVGQRLYLERICNVLNVDYDEDIFNFDETDDEEDGLNNHD